MAPRLHDLTVRAIRRIESDTGRPLDFIACWAEVADLDKRVRELRAPPESEAPDLLDAGITAGKNTFYRLSIGAWQWMDLAKEWWSTAPAAMDYAFWWAMAHSRSGAEPFRKAAGREAAQKIIADWLVESGATAEACRAAERCIYSRHDSLRLAPGPTCEKCGQPMPQEDDNLSMGPILATLCSLNPDPNYWTWDVDYNAAMSAYLNALAADPERERYITKRWADQAQARYIIATRALERKAKAE